MAKDPGKTLRTARLFPVGTTPRIQRDRLSASDTVDLWKVNLKSRSNLNLGLSGLSRRANANVTILDRRGRVVQAVGQPGNQTINNLLLQSGTYYVRVNLRRQSPATRYALSLQANPTTDQFGNAFSTASLLRTASGTLTDVIGSDDPNDFFGFGTLVAGQFNVSLSGLSSDANLELYDGNQKLLFASANPGTANEAINQRLTSIAGNYFLRVSSASGQDTNYTLAYSFVPDTPVQTASGLRYIDITTGTGPTPQRGQTVTVQYTGLLTNGTQFDSSRDRNQPFSFPIGEGRVIKGWDEGLSTMSVGSRRQLIIPPSLGYGSTGAGSIPPNATLIFDVEVIGIS
jgi:FKBP-type peptidyl-prolyl cis-trans isomerase/Bacterial pre-peptidase C-terminal domain